MLGMLDSSQLGKVPGTTVWIIPKQLTKTVHLKKYNSNKQMNKKRDMAVSFVKRFLEGSSGFRDAR